MMSWEELHRSVISWKPMRFRPADDEELDAFEAAAGLALPRSYREFVKIFGACEIGSKGINIARPRRKRMPNSRYDLASRAERMHDIVEAFCRSSDSTGRVVHPERSLRMVFFGDNQLGDTFGWDPEDISDAAAHEYAVYSRHIETEPYPRVAFSFQDFVLGYCLGDDLKRWHEAGRPVGEKLRFDCDPKDDPRLFISPA